MGSAAGTGAAILGWLLVEKLRDGHATSVGAASGVVAGLVAITPACGSLSPVGSLILGVVAGALAALAVGLKYRFGYDDSLDVVGVHLVGGLTGTVLIGFFALPSEGPAGLFYGGDGRLLLAQTVAVVVAVVVGGSADAVLQVGLLVVLAVVLPPAVLVVLALADPTSALVVAAGLYSIWRETQLRQGA